MELLSHWLPEAGGLQLDAWAIDPAQAEITLTLVSRQATSACPVCAKPAKRVHSRYQRTLADLPWGGFTVRLGLKVRKLFCDEAQCERRIFTERLPGVMAPWARRTCRLAERLLAIGLALGGAAGARLGRVLGLMASRNTLLRLIRAAPLPPEATPAVLGVDDWALRKRHRYGTVLVDLERRRPVALLPGREADVLAAWLQAHPGVTVIARDRSGAYIDGARRGAPEAAQVADRFHLLQNLAEALETLLTAHAKDLRALGRSQAEAGAASGGAVALAPSPPPARVAARAAERRRQRLARHQQAWALFRQGWSGEAVARELGIGRRTTSRWLQSETFPERQGRSDAGRSQLDRWGSSILERWNAGCRDGRRLHGELQGQGYRGSYPTVLRYLRRLRAAQGLDAPARPRSRRMPKPAAVPQRVLTPRAAAWLVLRRPEQRGTGDDALLARLRQQAPELGEAIDQAQAFAGLVRERRPERLDPWRRAEQDSRSPALRGFAKRLAADHDAVRAALIQPWSNGPTEGQINRLKMLKRTMYGRAGLDLLGRRFLLAA